MLHNIKKDDFKYLLSLFVVASVATCNAFANLCILSQF